jgi:catechol 2,3-dioxygenase-like lactoylglutathione lyase family enzyme
MAIQLDMIGLVVRDMAASLRFYRLLGMEIPEGVEGEPFVEVTTPNGYRVSWNSLEMVKGIDPDWIEPVGQRIGLAFKFDSPAEVDRKYSELVAKGYHGHKQPWDAFWGQRYAVIDDPDGSHIDLFAPLEE